MPRILGMEPRTALLVGGAVVVVAYLAWRARKSTAAAGAEAPPELPGADQALAATGASAQDTFAQQMQALELSSAQAEQQFASGQLQRQSALETEQTNLATGLLQWAQGKGRRPAAVMCPKGQPRFDPSTGQFYCREKQSRGFFSGLNLGKIIDAVNAVRPPRVTPGPGGF